MYVAKLLIIIIIMSASIYNLRIGQITKYILQQTKQNKQTNDHFSAKNK